MCVQWFLVWLFEKYNHFLLLLVLFHTIRTTCRKKLFNAMHLFVHLNLALALCLALVVFVAGVEPAAANEVLVCTIATNTTQ